MGNDANATSTPFATLKTRDTPKLRVSISTIMSSIIQAEYCFVPWGLMRDPCEIVHVHTADMDGNVKNTPMTWGVVVRDGLAYVNDMFNGLWIVRIKPPLGTKPVP